MHLGLAIGWRYTPSSSRVTLVIIEITQRQMASLVINTCYAIEYTPRSQYNTAGWSIMAANLPHWLVIHRLLITR